MNYFNYNGKIFKEGIAVIGPDNRGLRYGDGLFETMKMINSQLILGDEHFARMWKGLKLLQFDIPKHFTVEILQQEISSIAKKNGHDASARIRLQIVRGEGGLFDAKNHVPAYLIQTWPLAAVNGEWNSNGLVLGIYSGAKKSCDILSNLKHNNYLVYVMAALMAKDEKWNDAIVLNTYGRICDSAIANVFIIKDSIIYTPALTEGCVAGVMRKQVIQQLQKTNGEVVEKAIELDDLFAADEVFLTNSLYNIRWVQRIGEITYSNTVTQSIFKTFIQTIS